MKLKFITIFSLFFLFCGISALSQISCEKWKDPLWTGFTFPQVEFVDAATGTTGSLIFKNVFPFPDQFIQKQALFAARTLYPSSNDENLPVLQKIIYTLNKDDASSPILSGTEISTFFNSTLIDDAEQTGGTNKVIYDTRSALIRDLSNAYLLKPQGENSGEIDAYLTGMTYAVAYQNEVLPVAGRVPGGNWLDGNSITGYFLQWLTHKDPLFLHKINETALLISPWNFDDAIKNTLGSAQSVEGLWIEYQNFLQKSTPYVQTFCGERLKVKSIVASSYANIDEGPEKAFDGEIGTKWCAVTTGKWMEIELENEMEVCQWWILHGGMEREEWITSDFRLQGHDGEKWVDIDNVVGNKINITNREIAPFKTSKLRFIISKAQQTSNTAARIYEFKVYGRVPTSINGVISDRNEFKLINNHPNPVSDKTTIEYYMPQSADEVTFKVYNSVGSVVDVMTVNPLGSGNQSLVWDRKNLPAGFYPYTLNFIKNNTNTQLVGKLLLD